MRNFFTVFKFEYLGYLKSKSYIAVTVIMIILAIAAPSAPTVIGLIGKSRTESGSDSGKNTKLAAIISSTANISAESVSSGFRGYNFKQADRSEAMDMLSAGELDFVMEITGEATFKLFVGKMNIAQFDLMSMAENALRGAAETNYLELKGLSADDISGLHNLKITGELSKVAAGDSSDGEGDGQNGNSYIQKIVYAYILLFVLYMTMIMYGQYIVISIVSEKSSKAMELLITSTKPMNLMFGKVLGVGAAGLTQFILMLGCAFASYLINSMLWVSLDIVSLNGLDSTLSAIMTPVSPLIFVYLFIFFILGFLSYSFIYAGFASTASRIEEANTVSSVPILLIVASFFVAMFGLTNPGGSLITICSYIPFMSPMVMFMRICTDSAGNTAAVISIVILIFSIFLSAYLSAKIYRIGILMYGKPLKPAEMIKLFFKTQV